MKYLGVVSGWRGLRVRMRWLVPLVYRFHEPIFGVEWLGFAWLFTRNAKR